MSELLDSHAYRITTDSSLNGEASGHHGRRVGELWCENAAASFLWIHAVAVP